MGSLRESRKAVTLEITIQKPMQVLLLTWRRECLTKYDPANNSYKLRTKYKMQWPKVTRKWIKSGRFGEKQKLEQGISIEWVPFLMAFPLG